MFDLDKAVDEWGKSQQARHCLRRRNADTVEELKDHLLCEVERLQQEGLAAEEAFRQAARQMESASESLSDQHRRRVRRITSANAFMWAAVMVAVALLFSGTGNDDVNDRTSYLLLVVLIPAWFFSDRLIRKAMGADGKR